MGSHRRRDQPRPVPAHRDIACPIEHKGTDCDRPAQRTSGIHRSGNGADADPDLAKGK